MQEFLKQLLRDFVVNFPVVLRCTLFVLSFLILALRTIEQLWRKVPDCSVNTSQSTAVLPPDLRLLERLMPYVRTLSWRRRLGGFLYQCGNYFLRQGQLPVSEFCYQTSIDLTEFESWRTMIFYRALGAALFMQAKLPEAHKAFASAGTVRKALLVSRKVSSRVRSLDPAWFVAIGHMAMIDFYIKKRQLGWALNDNKIGVAINLDRQPGKLVAYAFRKHGIDFLPLGGFPDYYDQHKSLQDKSWSELSEDEHRAMVDSFWDNDFPDGDILTYTHGAAKIQNQWEREQRPPVQSLDESQRETLAALLQKMGIPAGAWFVCLHVREPGFHAKWNIAYPAARDAAIADYHAVIKAVTDRGGWVIRMGDPSMKPLPPMERVVDYALSPFKSEIGDIVIAASCKLFIGTNSGFATIPGIYGVPCVLTNWVPISLPLWFGQDLMIPKLFWHKGRQQYVDFEQILSTPLGATQNVADFPADIEIHDNTPQEIIGAVQEMFDRLDGKAVYTAEDVALQDRYFALALQCGSYKGSRIGRDFLRKYKHLLPAATEEQPRLKAVAI